MPTTEQNIKASYKVSNISAALLYISPFSIVLLSHLLFVSMGCRRSLAGQPPSPPVPWIPSILLGQDPDPDPEALEVIAPVAALAVATLPPNLRMTVTTVAVAALR